MIGLSRRTEHHIDGIEAVSVDLLYPTQLRENLSGVRDVTTSFSAPTSKGDRDREERSQRGDPAHPS